MHRGRWAEYREYRKRPSWNYVCRLTHSQTDDQPRVLSADYHYIEGEVQMHWPPTVDPFRSDGANNNNPQEGASNADNAMEPTQVR